MKQITVVLLTIFVVLGLGCINTSTTVDDAETDEPISLK